MTTKITTWLTALFVASVAAASTSATAQAQTPGQGNPLIGSWQHAQPESQSGPGMVFTMSFSADDQYQTTMAAAPWRGQVATILYTRGVYRITDDHSIVYRATAAELCGTGGGPCIECPGPSGFCATLPLRQDQRGSFQMQGPNQMFANGVSWYRQTY